MLELDTQSMLLDGLRRLDEMELYRTRVPGSDVVPRIARKPAAADQLTAEQHQVLARTDGKRSLAGIATATALGEFEATKAVYRLIESGILAV